MSGHRTRRRRGHPKGKAYGFRGLQPATKSDTSTQGASTASQSTPSTSTPSSGQTSDS